MKAAGSGIEPECEPMEASVWTTYHPAAAQRRTSRGSAHQTDALERKPELRRCSRRCFATRERPVSRIEVEARAFRNADATTRNLRYGRVLELLDLAGGKDLLASPLAERLVALDNNPAQSVFLHQPDMP
jgi:hypothetical protein